MAREFEHAFVLIKSLDALVEGKKDDSEDFKKYLSQLQNYVDLHKVEDLYVYNKLLYFIYRRDRRGSEDLFRFALSALKIQVSNDAIEYAARSLFYFAVNRDPDYVEKAFGRLREINFNPEELAFVNFIYGCIQHSKGNYQGYIEKLHYFQNCSLDTYFKIPASTSNSHLLINELLPPLIFKTVQSISPDRKIVICLSCDEQYFYQYSEFVITSAFKTQDSPLISISVITQSEDSKWAILEKIDRYDKKYIDVNFINPPGNIKPLSSLVRYLDAYSYSRLGVPIVVADLDSIFLADLSGLQADIPENYIGLRCRKDTCCPWEIYTAGFSYFGVNNISVEFLQLYAKYAASIFNSNYDQWWIDQNCLEASIRHLLIKNEEKFYVDLTPKLDKYIYLPTGLAKKNISTVFNNL
jgi:hypothetical protein